MNQVCPTQPKILLIDDQFTRHPGRYLQQQQAGGRWWIYDPSGAPLRMLNSAEQRFVCSAHEPSAINATLRHELGQAAWRVMTMERSNRELSAALVDAEQEVATLRAEVASLKAIIVNLPQGIETVAQ